MSNLILRSYAKLNLHLEVLLKRPDHYHNIKTLFERISLSDSILIKPRQDTRIRILCSSPRVPKGRDNLCYRSAKLLQEEFHIESGLDIRITKNIPVGAGLGGGSSNAASVLLGLNRLWKLGLSQERLAGLARQIGCDIPFFIYETPFALGEGRGDLIKPQGALKHLLLWHILVVPRLHVSTPLIYKKWDICSRKAGLTKTQLNVNILLSALKKKKSGPFNRPLGNSLEPVTLRLYPEVSRVKEQLAAGGARSILMSGSGPAVFGIVSSRKEAVFLGSKLKKKNRSWRVFVTRTA